MLVVGEFDLSIGYTASFAGVLVSGLIANQATSPCDRDPRHRSSRALVGFANGLLVTQRGVNAVVATLGVGTWSSGSTFGYNSGMPVVALPAAFSNIALSSFRAIPGSIWFMVLILAVLWMVLNRTPFGQRMQASGANAQAARLAGIRSDRAKTSRS